ncbi:hypothetical protein NP233_g7030 [Leucocoprinus birnbaumii]|uniref:Protein kinase domain-containing protein n=1 Tax=Leucocoprinus birnbaumii TaxID=56174 RepID=A0AAD5YV57_9AGAR|nr:hypothetical protein NP233_g7030 [Leucocoprinus birnbaumii]
MSQFTVSELRDEDILSDVVPSNIVSRQEAIINATLCLFFDVLAYGVLQADMQPRNIILRLQEHVSSSLTQCFDAEDCLLALDMHCDNLDMVMVNFEIVDFEKPDPSFGKPAAQGTHIEEIKPMYLERWPNNGMP